MPDEEQPEQFEDALGPEPEAEAPIPTIDAALFRAALGHFATGVTVITTVHDGEPWGLAVNSFTSVSLDPPLVAFCAAHSSTTWPHIQASGRYCVNVLAEDQESVCRVFAAKGADKFRDIDWTPSPAGSPVIDDALTWLDCSIEVEHEAGDHAIVVGRVHDLGMAEGGRPLLFFRGGYGRFEA